MFVYIFFLNSYFRTPSTESIFSAKDNIKEINGELWEIYDIFGLKEKEKRSDR